MAHRSSPDRFCQLMAVTQPSSSNNAARMGLEIELAFYARPSAQREMLIRNFEIGNQKSRSVEESRQFVSHLLKKINKLHRRCDRFSALNALRFPFSKTMRYRCPSGPAAIAITVPNSPSWFVPTIKTESPTLNSSHSLLMTCHFYSVSSGFTPLIRYSCRCQWCLFKRRFWCLEIALSRDCHTVCIFRPAFSSLHRDRMANARLLGHSASLLGQPNWPFMPTSSFGRAIFDALIAVWFLWGAPSLLAYRRNAVSRAI